MKQRKPTDKPDKLHILLLIWAMSIYPLLAFMVISFRHIWIVMGFAIIAVYIWLLCLFVKTGYADALYAHHLKRWEEREKSEAAKLYLGRKEE